MYVKIVVTVKTQREELAIIAERIRTIDSGVPLILQPDTPFGKVQSSPDAKEMLTLMRACEQKLEDVRVIPQTHRVYGAL